MNNKLVASLVIGIVLVAGLAVGLTLLKEDEIIVVYSEKVNYETLIVANERGMLEEKGMKGMVVTGGIEAAEALITGSASFAAMGDGPAVTLAAQYSHVKIVARFIDGENAHRFIASKSAVPDIGSIAGKGLGVRVGLQGSSSSHGAFLNWMNDNGIGPGDVVIVPMKPTELPLAVKSGEIDMMAGSEPWAVNTENLCGDSVHEIGNSAGLGSSYPILLLTTDRVIEKNPGAVRDIIEVMVEANAFINGDWEGAMEICASRTGLSLEDQEKCSGLQRYEVGFDDMDRASFDLAAAAMLQFGKISALPVVDDCVDLSFLPGA